jgi:uncharacterized membrane-anchored protein YhcB (DUF1043 family)
MAKNDNTVKYIIIFLIVLVIIGFLIAALVTRCFGSTLTSISGSGNSGGSGGSGS